MVIHCIHCGVLKLTKEKIDALNHEYQGFQWWMQFGIDKGILSQHKRAKGWKYEKSKIKYKDYPLVIPAVQVRYRKRQTKLTNHWIKISVRERKGVGIWLPIKPHKKLPEFQYLQNSLLILNKKDKYELRLIFDIPIANIEPQNILAIDLGERTIATIHDSLGKFAFLGKDIRGIRRHFSWLRRNLGKAKLSNKIKQIGNKEHRIINQRLHNIANNIIARAKHINAIIVLGKLKGIQKIRRSKKLNRIVCTMSYYSLIKMIEYKAEQNGLKVIFLDEYNTSRTCHKCRHCDKNNRKSQGLFHCTKCGLQYNADLNAVINIQKRAEEQVFSAGVTGKTLNPVRQEQGMAQSIGL